MAPCNHKKADTRLFLYALYYAQHNHQKVLIRSVDTDAVVLASRSDKEKARALSFGRVFFVLAVFGEEHLKTIGHLSLTLQGGIFIFRTPTSNSDDNIGMSYLYTNVAS